MNKLEHPLDIRPLLDDANASYRMAAHVRVWKRLFPTEFSPAEIEEPDWMKHPLWHQFIPFPRAPSIQPRSTTSVFKRKYPPSFAKNREFMDALKQESAGEALVQNPPWLPGDPVPRPEREEEVTWLPKPSPPVFNSEDIPRYKSREKRLSREAIKEAGAQGEAEFIQWVVSTDAYNWALDVEFFSAVFDANTFRSNNLLVFLLEKRVIDWSSSWYVREYFTQEGEKRGLSWELLHSIPTAPLHKLRVGDCEFKQA
jgi:hypothetical protein